jgi:hypothetical protein
MFKKHKRKLTKKIKVIIEYIFAIIRFIIKLLKVVIINRKNNHTVNDILLLLKNEYNLVNSEEQMFCLFRSIYRQKIPKNIERYYIEFKNKKRFSSKVERLKNLLYWLDMLDKTGAIFYAERFMKGLRDDAVIMVREKAEKTKGEGDIAKDIKNLENIPNYFNIDLVGVYRQSQSKSAPHRHIRNTPIS